MNNCDDGDGAREMNSETYKRNKLRWSKSGSIGLHHNYKSNRENYKPGVCHMKLGEIQPV